MFNFFKRSLDSKFIPGEVWIYKTRPQDEGSLLTVLKTEKSPIGNIVHLSLNNLKVKRPLPAPPEFITEAGHIPIREKELLKSVLEKVKEGSGVEDENEGYKLWKEKGESAFTVPLSEIVDLIEKGINNVHACPTCKKIHQSFSLSFNQPSYTLNSDNYYLTEDLCVIDDNYFIRGMLYIPIKDHEEPFAWGIWVTQSKENFEYYKKNFRKDLSGRTTFGYLSNSLPGYESTFNLETAVHFQGKGSRPVIHLQESEHQLYKDSIEGLAVEKADELMTLV